MKEIFDLSVFEVARNEYNICYLFKDKSTKYVELSIIIQYFVQFVTRLKKDEIIKNQLLALAVSRNNVDVDYGKFLKFS